MSKNIGNTIYDRSINYYETDQMGIVHHSNYIRYFEEARLDMMEQVGLSYAAMEEHGLIIPVLSVACEYIKPVLFGEKVQIHTRLMGSKCSLSMKYIVRESFEPKGKADIAS